MSLLRLWRGELPLDAAFWNWAVIGALAVNLACAFVFVLLLSEGFGTPALIAGYAVPIPYNLTAAVGVWRAAARYDGPPRWAALARWTSVVWLGGLSLVA